jgi:16S rRNA (cytosine1402-N4)-methyltransferase
MPNFTLVNKKTQIIQSSGMENKRPTYHIPALLKESMDGLQIKPSGIYVDVTLGGGGHSNALLERLDANGRLYGLDQDADAEKNIPADPRFVFVRANFRHLSHFMRYHNALGKVDGVLADLGVSFHHFDDPARGFSFRFQGNLDMRMNTRAGLTASDIINTYEEDALADIFYNYGEIRAARNIAASIVRHRKTEKIETVETLMNVLSDFIRKEKDKKFLSQLFQALRMEVNDEVNSLKEMLENAMITLKPGGRIAVISYHSIEDRLVKNFFRTGDFSGKKNEDMYGNVQTPFRIINNKVITPSEEEIENNPRSRSAKLRIAELI